MTRRYSEYLRQDQRLVILRILCEMPSYTANSSVLFNILGEYGHSPSRDQVKTEIIWLADQGLVTVDEVDHILIARVTSQGQDVAQGRTTTSGVKRPGA